VEWHEAGRRGGEGLFGSYLRRLGVINNTYLFGGNSGGPPGPNSHLRLVLWVSIVLTLEAPSHRLKPFSRVTHALPSGPIVFGITISFPIFTIPSPQMLISAI
jgi:hypothetical protein